MDFDFPLENTEPDPADDLVLDWILVAVDRHGEGLIINASPDFYKVDLITELYACDNGLAMPKGLASGLYRVTNIKVIAYEDDVEMKGEWFAIYAQGTSGSAQDRNGLDPKGAGPVSEGNAP